MHSWVPDCAGLRLRRGPCGCQSLELWRLLDMLGSPADGSSQQPDMCCAASTAGRVQRLCYLVGGSQYPQFGLPGLVVLACLVSVAGWVPACVRACLPACPSAYLNAMSALPSHPA